MAVISVSLPADGTTADVADYNTPITTIVNEINGNLDNTNLSASAAIAGTKLANGGVNTTQLADGGVTNAKLNTAAGAPGGAWQAYTPNPQGWAATPTTTCARYIQIGKIVYVDFDVTGTSNATTATFTLPVAPKSSGIFLTRATNNGTVGDGPGILTMTATSTTATLFRTTAAATWTASGTKVVSIYGMVYEAN